MPGLGDLVKKAFYMGVGMASYAGEKASSAIADLRPQAEKLANEMVERGEITAEEARRMVEAMIARAQQQVNPEPDPENPASPKEPRRIEILDEEDSPPPPGEVEVDHLRSQVNQLKEELNRLQRESSE